MRAGEDNAPNAEPAVSAGSHSRPVTCSENPSKWNGHAIFRSAHVEWGTPPDLRAALEKEFRFTLDPCTPGQVWDGLALDWTGQRVFCNPPYGRGVDKWLSKGPDADVAVFLLPARTDTVWFHAHALKASEIRFFKGRLKFCEDHIAPCDHSKRFKEMQSAPFPSMLVIYKRQDSPNDPDQRPGANTQSERKTPNQRRLRLVRRIVDPMGR